MTNEEANKEAIKGIERNICNHMDLCRWVDCEKCAVGLAINALKKQIPEIPDYEGDGYVDGEPIYDTWVCPRCGRHYEIDYDHYVYCPECGQRIDFDYGDE